MIRTLGAGLFSTILLISLTGCGAGDAQISVNGNGAKLVSLSVAPADPAIANNTDKQLIATGIYSDNTTKDVTAYVDWSSSDTSVATVGNNPSSAQLSLAQAAVAAPTLDNSGHAYAKAVGKTTITAKTKDTSTPTLTAETTLTVTPATLLSLSITPTNPSIAKGTSQQFTATGTFSDGTTQNLTASATWSSSNITVSTVSSSGLAASQGAGSATITATSAGVSGTATLTVTGAVLVSIAVTPANPSISKGSSQQFTATGTFSDGTTQNLTASVLWTSSDTSIADMSNVSGSQGLATSVNAGTVTITAASGSVSDTAALTVTAITAGPKTLSWNAPALDVDGEPITDLAGYKIYYGTSPGNYSSTIVVGNVTTYDFSFLSAGAYYFMIVSYDSINYENAYSSEISMIVQ